MNLFDFSIARLPRIIFSRNSINQVPDLCLNYGKKVLLVTGAKSFVSSQFFEVFNSACKEKSIQLEICHIPGEPSPQMVDDIVKKHKSNNIDVVLGLGGGSALDAAKAIAGLLRLNNSVMDYLEGVGPELPYEGPAVPFIAVPTTAGTGSEATKNAVLSVQGKGGFKKSFRDDALVAEYAVIDPELLSTCPTSVIAANGMDALTQLMESYVSTNSNVMTDALALSGLSAARDGLVALYNNVNDIKAQEQMAYASLMSGVCLAQTGLGSVHGLASPLGAFYPVPHGVVCGTLVAQATEMNIKLMLEREPENPALEKYAKLGDLITQSQHNSHQASRDALCDVLFNWTKEMLLPELSRFGLTEEGLDNVVANSRGSSMKTNPIVMSDNEIRELLLSRI